MENEEKDMLNEIIKRLDMLEHEKNIYKADELDYKTVNQPEKTIKLTPKVVFQIIFKAAIVAAITFALGLIIFLLFNNTNPKQIEPQIQTQPKVDSIITITKEDTHKKKMLIIQNSIDSLNNLFIQEVSGNGGSKIIGYGPNALKLKSKIDSLKLLIENDK